jgi:PadR family transcriptional regulator, regulatory protein PadR
LSKNPHEKQLLQLFARREMRGGNSYRIATFLAELLYGAFPVDNQKEGQYPSVDNLHKIAQMPDSRANLLQGTLDLMVLQTLDALGPLHGYGIARRIEQISENLLRLNQGTLYPALLRLQQRGWIGASWGTSENNRRAKFYTITSSGRKQLVVETKNWERISSMMARLMGGARA